MSISKRMTKYLAIVLTIGMLTPSIASAMEPKENNTKELNQSMKELKKSISCVRKNKCTERDWKKIGKTALKVYFIVLAIAIPTGLMILYGFQQNLQKRTRSFMEAKASSDLIKQAVKEAQE